jgi:hypothetical protein
LGPIRGSALFLGFGTGGGPAGRSGAASELIHNVV